MPIYIITIDGVHGDETCSHHSPLHWAVTSLLWHLTEAKTQEGLDDFKANVLHYALIPAYFLKSKLVHGTPLYKMKCQFLTVVNCVKVWIYNPY